jgi:hypothetical protein
MSEERSSTASRSPMIRNSVPRNRKTARQPMNSPSTPPRTWPAITPKIVPERK